MFQDSFEVSVWKRLNADPDSQKKSDHYVNIANSVIKRDKPINSAILSKTIDMLYVTQSDGMQTLIDQLLEKSRTGDCVPMMTAALVYTKLERWDKAEHLVETAKHTHNIPLVSCVKAKIQIQTGESAKAKKELMRARCSDPSFPMFYEIIQQIEPAEGWMYRQNIELLVSGKEPIPFGDNTDCGPAEVLYEIYYNWYRGKRDKATELMINSEEYKKKNPEYVLASARMSMDERDWHSAQRMYTSLLSKSANCVYIICEAAKAFYFGGNYEKALSLYRDAEALDPVSPNVMKGLIQTYSALGMKGEASQCIKEYLDTETADLEAFVEGAKILLSNSLYSDAESVTDMVLLSYPMDPAAFILKSEIEFQRGNINASLRTIMNGIEKNPDNADVRLQKAKILFKTGRTDKALVDLNKAEKTDPNNVGVLLLHMDIAASKGDNEESLRLSNRVLELDPGNIDAMNTLSKASLSARTREGSYASYKDMMVADNRAENFINILSSMIIEGKYEEVVQLYTEKEREYGINPAVKQLKGNAEYALGDYKAASATYMTSLLLDPKDPVIWHSKGMADEMLGDLDHAEEAYNRAILLDMNEPEFWISRSSIQFKKRDLAGAVESLNRVIELRPDNVYALVKKGMIFAELGKFNEASYFLDMAIVIDPDNLEVLRIKRDVLMAMGDVPSAELTALRMVDADHTNAEAVTAAVRILSMGGKDDVASGIIENALRDSPRSMPLLITKKDFFTFRGDNRAVIDACQRILEIQPDNSMVKNDLAEAYAAVGDMNSANRIYSEMDTGKDEVPEQTTVPDTDRVIYEPKVPDSIKRYAERVLRRAYVSKMKPNDPDLISALDLDDATSKAIMAYLSDISEYGEIVPGTLEFERMEKLSLNAIVKGNCANIDEDPIISLPCAYVAGGAKDADEAKLLVAYIYKVMTARKTTRSLSSEMKKMIESTPKDSKTEDIVKKARIGVYQARMIKDNL